MVAQQTESDIPPSHQATVDRQAERLMPERIDSSFSSSSTRKIINLILFFHIHID